jgi:hypothetical protein
MNHFGRPSTGRTSEFGAPEPQLLYIRCVVIMGNGG